MDHAQIIQQLRTALPELRRHHAVAELGLFGSFARGSDDHSSDPDILVRFPPGRKRSDAVAHAADARPRA